jgi:hypothetical protein
MTQNLRVKWVLGLVSANAVMAATALGVGIHHYRAVRAEAASARADLRSSELDAAGLKASLASRPVSCPPAQPPQSDPQLTQTLQVLASEQQILLMRQLQQTAPEASPKSAPRLSARRAPRKRRPITTCLKPQ